MRRWTSKVLYWLSEWAHTVHECLYDLASRDVVKARANAYRYQSLAYTFEALELANDRRFWLTKSWWQCNYLLSGECKALEELKLQLQQVGSPKETEAT